MLFKAKYYARWQWVSAAMLAIVYAVVWHSGQEQATRPHNLW